MENREECLIIIITSAQRIHYLKVLYIFYHDNNNYKVKWFLRKMLCCCLFRPKSRSEVTTCVHHYCKTLAT